MLAAVNRCQAIATAKASGFNAITLIWFDVPLETCLRRNRERSRQVPPEVIVQMYRQLCRCSPLRGRRGESGAENYPCREPPETKSRIFSKSGLTTV